MMQLIFAHYPGSKYGGGWTIVEAEDVNQAIAIFRIFHPDKRENFVDCAGIFTESTFRDTKMFRHGNYGKRVVERIALTRMEAEDEQSRMDTGRPDGVVR